MMLTEARAIEVKTMLTLSETARGRTVVLLAELETASACQCTTLIILYQAINLPERKLRLSCSLSP